MKQLYKVLLFLLLFASCKSLKKNDSDMDTVLFNKGLAIFEVIEEAGFDYELEKIDTTTTEGQIKFETLATKKEDILDFALEQFESLADKYPDSKLYPKALYNLAHICSILEYEQDEINYLKKILNSDANDKEDSGRKGLMSNPYANFKNDASNRLVEIYINKGDFDKALTYQKLNEKYPFQHFCGNAFAEDELKTAEKYAKIYNGKGDTEKALKYLLPHLFDHGLANNLFLVKLTIETLKKDNSISAIQAKFDQSIRAIYSKKHRSKDAWASYYIRFQDTEIRIPTWNLRHGLDKKEIEAEIEQSILVSTFYKMLHAQKQPVLPKL